MNLQFTYLGNLNVADYKRQSAYTCTSLVKDGTWYVGLEEGWNSMSVDSPERVARFWGFACNTRMDHAAGDLAAPVVLLRE